MGAPYIYRYDDDNAPICAGVDTALVGLLTACLVDGYGIKPGAGWTREFVNAEETKAVFRNNPTTGTGFYLRIDNSSSPNHSDVKAYEAMTDIDTGVEPFTTTSRYMCSSNVASTVERPWILIADDRFFYLIVWNLTDIAAFNGQSYLYTSSLLFGDGISLHEDDEFFCYFTAGYAAYHGAYFSFPLALANTANTSHIYVARNIAGDAGENRCVPCFSGGPAFVDSGSGHTGQGIDRIPGLEIFSRPYINDGAPLTLRGYLPGYWHHCHKRADFDNFEETTVGGHVFMTLNCSSSTGVASIISIDISENFRP